MLRILDKLDIRLEATSGEQRHIDIPFPSGIHNALREAASAVHTTRVIDAAAAAQAAAAAINNIDISALASAAHGSAESSAVAAAIRTIDTTTPLARWRRALDDLTGRVQETAAREGSEPTAEVAREALLNAAIKAGDPDREVSNREPHD